jgi:lysophospholipase L1-like esterase
MTWGRLGKPYWRIVVSALAGALVAGSVMTLIGGRQVVVHEAAATHSATGSPAAATTAAAKVHSVTFLGDSWTDGWGATALRGYAVLTGEQLGWQYWALGVGGSGYDVPGRGATFDQRVDRAVETHPDVIVVQGSLNEFNSTPEALTVAADQTLAHLKAAASSHTRILVLGSSYAPAVPDATIDWINADLQAAAAKAGLPFVNPAAENWTDAKNPAIWADPYHPNDAGYQLVADHLEPLLRSLVAG